MLRGGDNIYDLESDMEILLILFQIWNQLLKGGRK